MSEDETSKGIKQVFAGLGEGLRISMDNKIQEYVRRIISGEPEENIYSGLSPVWRDELQQRVAVARHIEDEELTWEKVSRKVPSTSFADRKIFEYSTRVLRGEQLDQVTEGLPETWKNRVSNYIDATRELALHELDRQDA